MFVKLDCAFLYSLLILIPPPKKMFFLNFNIFIFQQWQLTIKTLIIKVTSLFVCCKSWTTVQTDLIGWSFETSEQQKKNLLHPLFLSNSHLIYTRASVDNLSTSYRIIAAKMVNNSITRNCLLSILKAILRVCKQENLESKFLCHNFIITLI